MTETCEPQSQLEAEPARRFRRTGLARYALLTGCFTALCASTLFAQVRGTYLYNLSNFGGQLHYSGARIYADTDHDETYVVYQNLVRIFNASGMELFRFGDDLNLGQLLDVTVDRGGDIILLSIKDTRTLVTRCNFRGVPIGPVEITNVPEPLTFVATRMVYRNDRFYFANLTTLSLIVTESSGEFREHIEFLALLEADERKKDGGEMSGFDVDRDGNVFFTIPALFKIYKYSPDGNLISFGRPGAAGGKFGIVAGIATDSRGNVLVADKLKCVIIVFDKDFNFLTEFGQRGFRPENLIVPNDIALDRMDRVYVAQARKRGISVFALTGD